MNEQEFDPRDTNKDGKVSARERLLDAANKANEAIDIAAGVIRDEAKELYGKVKDYQALSPEEKKARQDEWKDKATDAANKAADTAKEFAQEVKEEAEKLFGNNKTK
jgi:ribonucleotide reductase beta subunit family protein with ferritin-like domain